MRLLSNTFEYEDNRLLVCDVKVNFTTFLRHVRDELRRQPDIFQQSNPFNIIIFINLIMNTQSMGTIGMRQVCNEIIQNISQE